MRCMLAVSTVDAVIERYNQWFSDDMFTVEQMETIRTYLQPILLQKGIEKPLPVPAGVATEDQVAAQSAEIEFAMPESQEEVLDVTSIGITFVNGSQKGNMVEFDVNFQSGEMLSLIIPRNDRGLIDDLNDGDKLEDIQFYSPIAIFTGTAVITQKTQIEAGPKKGDFCLDLKIISA